MKKSRAALLGLALVSACAPSDPLRLPPLPNGARALILAGLGAPEPALYAFDGDEDGNLALVPIKAHDVKRWIALFLSEPLARHALSPGVIPLSSAGELGRHIPEPQAVFGAELGAEWNTLPASLPSELTSILIPSPRSEECVKAGGCLWPFDDPSGCALPCPCSQQPFEQRPVPIEPRCPLPTVCRLDDRWVERSVTQSIVGTIPGGIHPGEQVGSVQREAGVNWLYFASDRLDRATIYWTRVFRVRLAPDGSPEPASLEPVPLFPGQDGYLNRPMVRADGLEMLLQATFDVAAKDRALYISTRPAIDQSWGSAVVIGTLDLENQTIEQATMLADQRTILYFTAGFRPAVARRSSTTRGDLEFAADFNTLEDAENQIEGYSASCDGGHVYYFSFDRETQRHALWLVKILSLDPLRYGPRQAVLGEDGAQLSFPPVVVDTAAAESPDCTRLYLTIERQTHIYQRTFAQEPQCPR